MRVTPATIDDVWFVLKDAHPWHTDEIKKANLSMSSFLDLAGKWLDAEGAECLYLDDRPACVVGYDGGYTWFLATAAYYAGGLKVLRHAKRYWAEVAKKREVLSLVLSRPELLRWLGLLGFEPVEQHGQHTLLRLSTKPTNPVISQPERA